MRRRRYSKTEPSPSNPLSEACRSPALWLLVLFAIGGLFLRGRSPSTVTTRDALAPQRGPAAEIASAPTEKAAPPGLKGTKERQVSRERTASSMAPRNPSPVFMNVESAAAWAESDLRGALDWAVGATSRVETLQPVLAVSEVAARTEPVAAIDIAAGLAPSPVRDQALAHAVSQWADTQPEEAAQWAAQVQDPELRNELLAAVAVASAEEHPEFAGELAVTNLTAGPVQNNAIVSVVQRWVQRAPEDAAAWVSNFPEGPVRSAATENLFEIWTAQDRSGAEHYVDQMPQGWLREAGQMALAQVVSPAEALPNGIPQQALQ